MRLAAAAVKCLVGLVILLFSGQPAIDAAHTRERQRAQEQKYPDTTTRLRQSEHRLWTKEVVLQTLHRSLPADALLLAELVAISRRELKRHAADALQAQAQERSGDSPVERAAAAAVQNVSELNTEVERVPKTPPATRERPDSNVPGPARAPERNVEVDRVSQAPPGEREQQDVEIGAEDEGFSSLPMLLAAAIAGTGAGLVRRHAKMQRRAKRTASTKALLIKERSELYRRAFPARSQGGLSKSGTSTPASDPDASELCEFLDLLDYSGSECSDYEDNKGKRCYPWIRSL